MSNQREAAARLTLLQQVVKLRSAWMAKSGQPEAALQEAFDQEMQALQSGTTKVGHRVADYLRRASSSIARQIKDAVAQVAALATALYQPPLRSCKKPATLCGPVWRRWCDPADCFSHGLTGLGYNRRELSTVKGERQSYELAPSLLRNRCGGL